MARAALARGHTVTAAAARAGVTRETLQGWLCESDALRQARAEGRALLEGAVLSDAMTDGRLALEVLSRRYRVWQKRDLVKADVTLTDNTIGEDPAARAARLRSLAAALESALPMKEPMS